MHSINYNMNCSIEVFMIVITQYKTQNLQQIHLQEPSSVVKISRKTDVNFLHFSLIDNNLALAI